MKAIAYVLKTRRMCGAARSRCFSHHRTTALLHCSARLGLVDVGVTRNALIASTFAVVGGFL